MLLVSQLKCILHNNIFLQCLLTVGFNYTVIKDGETAVNGSLLVQMILVHQLKSTNCINQVFHRKSVCRAGGCVKSILIFNGILLPTISGMLGVEMGVADRGKVVNEKFEPGDDEKGFV